MPLNDRELTEKEFLIDLAVRQFNRQYQKNIKMSDCTIRSVPAHYGRELGYEITTPDVGIPGDTSDTLRLRMYLGFSVLSSLSPYRLEVEQNLNTPGELGDEVYVTTGTLMSSLRTNRVYAFNWIDVDENPELALLDVDGEALRWMDGSYLETMTLTEEIT